MREPAGDCEAGATSGAMLPRNPRDRNPLGRGRVRPRTRKHVGAREGQAFAKPITRHSGRCNGRPGRARPVMAGGSLHPGSGCRRVSALPSCSKTGYHPGMSSKPYDARSATPSATAVPSLACLCVERTLVPRPLSTEKRRLFLGNRPRNGQTDYKVVPTTANHSATTTPLLEAWP